MTKKKLGIAIVLALLVVIATSAITFAQTKPLPKEAYKSQKASGTGVKKEQCEQYYEKSKQYADSIERQGSGTLILQANISTAYGLLYQNCVARNKR